jgi:hypothetical protein
MINYDHEDGVSVASKLTSSILTVRNATARHGGKLKNETSKLRLSLYLTSLSISVFTSSR